MWFYIKINDRLMRHLSGYNFDHFNCGTLIIVEASLFLRLFYLQLVMI